MIFKKAAAFLSLLFPALAFPQISGLDGFLSESERIFVVSQHTDANTASSKADWRKRSKLKEITFAVRMPDMWTKEKDAAAKKAKIPSVRGVIAICTWDNNPEKLKSNISYGSSPCKHLIKFADKNNLAVITWSNFGGYSASTSSDEMDKSRSKDFDFMFNDRLSEWEAGFKRVLSRHNLPDNSIMLYGISGGAQIAHRIALRRPKYFSGIHIHVNSSYDIPTPNAKNIVWLVTTGELEYGYAAATRFYQKMIDLGYAVIFKAGENLGHAANSQINNLSMEFFKYMITFIPDYSDPNCKAPPIDKFYLMKHPTFVGDYMNQVAYPFETAAEKVAARKYMVALPTRPIAEAWGDIIEK